MRILFSLQITATALGFGVLAGNCAEAADAAQGEHVFVKCAPCHAKDKTNGLGPGLSGVVGRHAGSVSGFGYSQAMKNSNIVWSAKSLDAFIVAPQKASPGTAMPFPGLLRSCKLSNSRETRVNILWRMPSTGFPNRFRPCPDRARSVKVGSQFAIQLHPRSSTLSSSSSAAKLDQGDAPLDDSSHAETAVAVIFSRATRLPSFRGHDGRDAADDELDGFLIAFRQRARSEHGVGRLS